jgi:hypothetical protein
MAAVQPFSWGNGEPWLLLQEMTHRVCNEYTAAISVLSLASARTLAVVGVSWMADTSSEHLR